MMFMNSSSRDFGFIPVMEKTDIIRNEFSVSVRHTVTLFHAGERIICTHGQSNEMKVMR